MSFMVSGSLLLCSQQQSDSFYPKPDESNPHPTYYLPIYAMTFKWYLFKFAVHALQQGLQLHSVIAEASTFLSHRILAVSGFYPAQRGPQIFIPGMKQQKRETTIHHHPLKRL
jgi:hypothetical protein